MAGAGRGAEKVVSGAVNPLARTPPCNPTAACPPMRRPAGEGAVLATLPDWRLLLAAAGLGPPSLEEGGAAGFEGVARLGALRPLSLRRLLATGEEGRESVKSP